MRLVKKNAANQSKEILVFISLLLDMLARAQDVIGVPYSIILDAKRMYFGPIYRAVFLVYLWFIINIFLSISFI